MPCLVIREKPTHKKAALTVFAPNEFQCKNHPHAKAIIEYYRIMFPESTFTIAKEGTIWTKSVHIIPNDPNPLDNIAQRFLSRDRTDE